MKTEQFILKANGWVPNNEPLPVLIYREVVAPGHDRTAECFEQLFRRHGWPPRWRDSVYDYHHYHSTTHEALGIANGSGTLQLGGPGGRALAVRVGDAVVLPAGTGHRRLKVSPDFLVIGAYPAGYDWDICRATPSAEQRERMRTLPVPPTDPILGVDSLLGRCWTS